MNQISSPKNLLFKAKVGFNISNIKPANVKWYEYKLINYKNKIIVEFSLLTELFTSLKLIIFYYKRMF
jgi:hypothetical protein